MIFKRVKKIFSLVKKPSRKNFWKIGLFLVFVGVMMNVNVGKNNNIDIISAQAQLRSAQERREILVDSMKDVGNAMGIEIDNNGRATNVSKMPLGIGTDTLALVFEGLLWGILQVVHWLVLLSAFIFDWTIKPESFDVVVRNNSSVYIAWAMVRDFLNLFFMLALLFSAFSTIFQVEKYHLKKIIILLVVMALLVNFSFPITRFVIDFSNSIMYFFIGLIQQATNTNAASSSSALISEMTEMGMLTKAMMEQTDIPALILSIIFQFILFVTLFAFAINLLIRILAFAILLIFAPAGFALSFFPSTSSMADSWWSSLIKYAVLGPLMIFFLLLANLMFNATVGQQQFNTPTTLNQDSIGFVGSSLLFTIPIVFLWMGLIVSNKFGGAASSTAMGIAKNTGNKIKKGAWNGTKMLAVSTGVPGGIKQKYTNIANKLKSGTQAKEARIAASGPLKDPTAVRKDIARRADEYAKNHETIDSLKEKAKNGDMAASYRLAQDGKMDATIYAKIQTQFKDPKTKEFIDDKVKEKRIDLVIHQKIKDEASSRATMKGISFKDASFEIADEEFGKLNKESWKKVNFEKLTKSPILRDSARRTINDPNKMDPLTKQDIRKELSGNNLAAASIHGIL